MTDSELRSKLQDYVAWAHLWHHLDGDHTREDLNDLLVKQFETEIEILKHFGLPHTYYYSEHFQFLGLQKKFKLKHIDVFLKQLKAKAKEYHQTPVISDLQLLELAQVHKLDIEEVLPELSLRLQPEPYYTYLYFALLMSRTATAADILQELNTIHKHDLSLKLCMLSQDKSLLKQPDYQELLNYELKFLEAFLEEFETRFDFLHFVKLHDPL
ncbi:MAG TPA: hypothetical protein VGE58_09190 [Daejeonella sp.]